MIWWVPVVVLAQAILLVLGALAALWPPSSAAIWNEVGAIAGVLSFIATVVIAVVVSRGSARLERSRRRGELYKLMSTAKDTDYLTALYLEGIRMMPWRSKTRLTPEEEAKKQARDALIADDFRLWRSSEDQDERDRLRKKIVKRNQAGHRWKLVKPETNDSDRATLERAYFSNPFSLPLGRIKLVAPKPYRRGIVEAMVGSLEGRLSGGEELTPEELDYLLKFVEHFEGNKNPDWSGPIFYPMHTKVENHRQAWKDSAANQDRS